MQSIYFSETFIFFVCILSSLSLMTLGIKKNLKILLFGGMLPIVLFMWNQQTSVRDEMEGKQTKYVQEAFNTLYRPDYLQIEKTSTKDGINNYQLTTQGGSYRVDFDENTFDTFRVVSEDGESLRGRKNVFDILEMIGLSKGDGYVIQEEKETYIYEEDETNRYTITMEDEEVILIEDQTDRIIYRNENKIPE